MVLCESPSAVLGVPPAASLPEVKAAYRLRVLQTHPDKGGSAEEFRLVQTAFESLVASKLSGVAAVEGCAYRRSATSRGPRRAASFDAAPSMTCARDRERTPRRQQRKPRKPSVAKPAPRQLSPRALARKMGMFPQPTLESFGFPLL
mmetsp:Transcript_15394/g.27515  ORF Transcript_15394/g.27515 Transcript_15394/m.27515 type:complete len:147 (-) Transcript_15394:262-702(-)